MLQGPKLTFLGRCQLAMTDFFFQLPYRKIWSPNSVNKIFPSKRYTNRWKILVANFSFKNQKEVNMFGASMAIFPLTNKMKYKHADYLYT